MARQTAVSGMYAPGFFGHTADGREIEVSGSKALVILLLRSDCEYSRRSMATWRSLAERLDPEGTGTVVVIRNGLSPDMDVDSGRADTLLPVVSFPSRRTKAMYRGTLVPQTLVIDGDGLVRYAKLGVFESTAALDSVLAVWHGLNVSP
jgi:hypothetical protein